MSKLLDYLPDFLAKYRDIICICSSEEPEFELIGESLDRASEDMLISTASNQRIYDYESMLNIVPATALKIRFRRERLLAYLSCPPSFALQDVISEIEAASLSHSVTYEILYYNHTFSIDCDVPDYMWSSIYTKLKDMIPANYILNAVNHPSRLIEGHSYTGGTIATYVNRRIS